MFTLPDHIFFVKFVSLKSDHNVLFARRELESCPLLMLVELFDPNKKKAMG